MTSLSPTKQQTLLAVQEGIDTVEAIADEYGLGIAAAKNRIASCRREGFIAGEQKSGRNTPCTYHLTPAGRIVVGLLSRRPQ